MWSIFKKLLLLSLLLFALSWAFNIKVADKPARQWTSEVLNSNIVQKAYAAMSHRIKALIRQEISLEQFFSKSPTPPPKDFKSFEEYEKHQAEQGKKVEQNSIPPELRERLSEKDQQILQEYLEKNR